MTNLFERIINPIPRHLTQQEEADVELYCAEIGRLHKEAAAEIIADEIMAWPDAIDTALMRELEKMRARVAELEAALCPFAGEAAAWTRALPDNARMFCYPEGCGERVQAEFTLGDVRRAATSLAASAPA